MGIALFKSRDLFSPQNKRLALIFAFFLIALSVFSFISKNSATEFAADELGRKIAPQKNDPEKIGSQSRNRIIKVHLLQKTKEAASPSPDKERRNIFRISGESSSGLSSSQTGSTQAGSPQGGGKDPKLVVPPFPYKIIGKVRFLKPGGPEEYAVIFNGFGNLFVKEGEMIDPNYKLVKLNEDDADIQYVGLDEILKVEIKGN